MRRMMLEPIPPQWKLLWDTWDLRIFIVLSLSLQAFMILVAPLRKRTNRIWVMMSLWTAYLLADWVANFAVGLILSSQGDRSRDSGENGRTPVVHKDLLAFWAPFLLVHLGGPDTITALALEDNELWLRHLFGLVFQCVAVVYVFLLSLPDNRLWIPTVLMFLTGMIKYLERTRSLYLASADKFKHSMLKEANPDTSSTKLMHLYNSMTEANLPARIAMIPVPHGVKKNKLADKAKKGSLTKLEVVQYGHLFYEKFVGLFVNKIYNLTERNQSRDFFLNRNSKDAFNVIAVELNLIYEVLFTKFPVVYGKYGAITRFFSLVTVCLAIIIFKMKSKTNFSESDVTITYALLFGALVLDLTTLFMFWFSDWSTIALRGSPDAEPANTLKNRIINFFLTLRFKGASKETKRKPKPKGIDQQHIVVDQTQSNLRRGLTGCMNQKLCRSLKVFANRRWSETINTFNIIDYCLRKKYNKRDDTRFCSKVTFVHIWEKLIDMLGVDEFLDRIIYVKPKAFSDSLRDFIFDELKSKSEFFDDLETATEISSARGDWVLRVEVGGSGLLKYVAGHVGDLDYDQSLIVWHIATELLYNEKDNIYNPCREISKLLSDYMLYLLSMQPIMMSSVPGISQIRFLDNSAEVCAHVKQILEQVSEFQRPIESKQMKKHACKEILNVPGTNMKSILFQSRNLATALMEIEEELMSERESNPSKIWQKPDKWLIISKVWVEMLCYAAINSRPDTQIAPVSKGGELITVVWLLMVHFGLSDKFKDDESKEEVRLIVGK